MFTICSKIGLDITVFGHVTGFCPEVLSKFFRKTLGGKTPNDIIRTKDITFMYMYMYINMFMYIINNTKVLFFRLCRRAKRGNNTWRKQQGLRILVNRPEVGDLDYRKDEEQVLQMQAKRGWCPTLT